MRQRNVTELLQDIVQFCRMAREFAGANSEIYLADKQRQRAVERCLQVAGEAMTQLVTLDVNVVYRITDTRKIIAFRHLLTHHYYRVTQQFVWQIVQTSVLQLEQEAAHALAAQPGNEEEQ